MSLPDILIRTSRQGTLGVLWGALPFPLAEKSPAQRTMLLNRWRAEVTDLPGSAFWLPGLPPVLLLSLDPTDRVEQAFTRSQVPLQVLRTRRDVPTRGQHGVLKLAGDLETRQGLILSRAEIRKLRTGPDKRHLLAEARRRLDSGVLLLLGCDPASQDFRAWWAVLAAALANAAFFALGDPAAAWPEDVVCLEADFETLKSALWAAQPEPEATESAPWPQSPAGTKAERRKSVTETVRIFISSTWQDLQPERAAVEKALHRMQGAEFSGMEYFGSRPETPRAASLAEVDRSDIYVGLFAHRYGSGITEAEYRRARERGLPCLIYLKDEEAPVRPAHTERDPDKIARLEALKQALKAQHIVSLFTGPDQLATQVATDLHNFLGRKKPVEKPAESGPKYEIHIHGDAYGQAIGDGTTVIQDITPEKQGAQSSQPGADQRCTDLADNIQETWSLIKLYEEQRRLSGDPKQKVRAEREIADLRKQLSAYEAEARKLGCA